jgi:hypothetical protein
MPRRTVLNLLTAPQRDLAQAGERLQDGGGLVLEVTAAGSKYWRFRYTRPNASQLPASKKQNRLSFGRYPKPVSLAGARAQRDEFSQLLARGIDPSEYRRHEAVKVAAARENSLWDIAETWFAKQGSSERHLSEWKRTLNRNVFDQVMERAPHNGISGLCPFRTCSVSATPYSVGSSTAGATN